MSTLTQLRTMVRRDVRDPDITTFTNDSIKDFINAGIAEISRIAPKQTIEEIAYVADTTEYACTLTEVMRVEVWDTFSSPSAFAARIVQSADNDLNSSQTGWELWATNLSVPAAMQSGLTAGTHSFRVWGWGPYAQLVDDADATDFLDVNLEMAVREYATMRGFEYLLSDRSLFEQWATQANNTDVTPAALANILGLWMSKWERRRKQLREIRQLP